MKEYYIFQTVEQAQGCIDYINSTPWFPIVGKKNGEDALESQATTVWIDVAVEMLSGEFAVPRIPSERLDYLGVPQEDRDAFVSAFVSDMRELTSADFPQEELT